MAALPTYEEYQSGKTGASCRTDCHPFDNTRTACEHHQAVRLTARRLDPDPRFVPEEVPTRHWDSSWGGFIHDPDFLTPVEAYKLGRSSFRWYLLASFVTGLLLGAALGRLL